MATLTSFYKFNKGELDSNFGVDYVIHYQFPAKERNQAEAAFIQLIQELTKIGLATEVRNGGKSSVLIFVKAASENHLQTHIYKARLQDWLYGVRAATPGRDITKYFEDEPVTEAERLRLIYLMITKPKNEGGAGITITSGQWKYVQSIFPLHNHSFNRSWIKEWSTKYILEDKDIGLIREKFGEKVALYFAFLQAYFKFLVFPAAFGFSTWLILGQFSWLYAIANSLWTVVFFEYWKKKEVDLAVTWGVRGVSKIQHPRPQFKFEQEAEDPVTGEIVKVYSPLKRLKTQLLQVPFTLACVIILGSLIAMTYSVEIFISEVYDGPLKSYLVFVPTVILTTGIPTLSTLLTKVAHKLTDMENYETNDAHHAALVQKMFVINFMTSYMALFITSFIYLPFGSFIIPYLDIFDLTQKHLGSRNFQTNPGRLSKQLFYLTVTAQIVNFLMETVVPYVKRRAVQKVLAVKSSRKGEESNKFADAPEEATFLERVRNEAELDKYDVTGDLREMVIQFGYLSLFSVVWPLVGFSFLVNNWIEARSDAMKIAIGSQRPIPWRADSIGPWLNSLEFLSWLGSITSSALVYMFSGGSPAPGGGPSHIKGWQLLLSILLAEHFYLVVQQVVRYVLDKMDSPGLQKERAVRFTMRKTLLRESFGDDAGEKSENIGVEEGEKITREALEDDARRASTQGQRTPEEMFWQRQQGMSETIEIGRKLIAKIGSE